MEELAWGEAGHVAGEGRVEAEDDLVFGNAEFVEFDGDAGFGAVLLNPNFAVNNIDVEDYAIDAFGGAKPADMDELVVVAFSIENGLGHNALIPNTGGPIAHQLFDILPVGV